MSDAIYSYAVTKSIPISQYCSKFLLVFNSKLRISREVYRNIKQMFLFPSCFQCYTNSLILEIIYVNVEGRTSTGTGKVIKTFWEKKTIRTNYHPRILMEKKKKITKEIMYSNPALPNRNIWATHVILNFLVKKYFLKKVKLILIHSI